jgi:N-acetyl-anhydromuramyl-L-alanine amidase AmpD
MIQAVNYTPANRTDIRVLVIHTMESPEKPGTARGVAEWFAGKRGAAPKASAHYCVDELEVVQCVRHSDVAWHAPGANRTGIGIELAGRAAQSADDWQDAASTATLELAAELCCALATAYGIPVRRLTPAQISAGERGICGHVDVTLSCPDKGHGHYDPGPNFPWDGFLSRVEQYSSGPRSLDPHAPGTFGHDVD